MTQEELEKASGVSRVTISNIERGALKNMKVDTMRALAHALHEKPENIFLLWKLSRLNVKLTTTTYHRIYRKRKGEVKTWKR